MVVIRSFMTCYLLLLIFTSCNEQRKVNAIKKAAEQSDIKITLTADTPDSTLFQYLEGTKDNSGREESISRILKIIHSCFNNGDTMSAKRLYNIYKQVYTKEIPFQYLISKPVCALNDLTNFSDTVISFELRKGADLRIFATGEGLYNMKTSILPPWFNDNLEIFFDMQNNKLPYFDRSSDDRQYFFSWNKKEIEGQNISVDGLEFKQYDPTENSYVMEIKFPWRTLGYIAPKHNTRIGFDIMIDDNDAGDLEAQVTWHSNNGQLSNKTSYFGTVILDSLKHRSDGIDSAYVWKTSTSPSIDGVEDNCWKNVPAHNIKQLVSGEIDNQHDIYGTFKLLWDTANLYMFIKVNDNKKMQGSALFDYGWIENNKGDTLWTMNVEKSNHAGGAFKNRSIDTVIHLPVGKYKLRYITDNSHAYGDWDDHPPLTSIYGINIYHEIK